MAMAVQGRTPARPRDPTGTVAPRSYLFDELFAHKYDDATLDHEHAPSPLLALAERTLPSTVRLALAIQRRQQDYDVVLSWGERLTFALAGVQTVSGRGRAHVAMLYWFSKPAVRLPLRAFGNSLQAIVTWSSVQREYAIERLGIGAEKIYLIKHYADQLFWSPREREIDMICSAGSEMRDYPTLFEALRGTGIRCHVASDHVRAERFRFGRRIPIEAYRHLVGDSVTIGRTTWPELRELYARSRFVVVPLRPSDTDNGVTVILEAMAMGKPVIVSRTQGQVDVVEDGVTGIYVPVGDARALRAAMLDLWNNPARAAEMGRAARAYVEEHHTLDMFCQNVRAAIDASLDGHPAARDGSFHVPASTASAGSVA
jgi:glycosyltransferase involved in cell wall biosynthesis